MKGMQEGWWGGGGGEAVGFSCCQDGDEGRGLGEVVWVGGVR